MVKKQHDVRRQKYEVLKAEYEAAMEILVEGRTYELLDERGADGRPVFRELPDTLSERASSCVNSLTATIDLLEEDVENWKKTGALFAGMACRALALLRDAVASREDPDGVWAADRGTCMADLEAYLGWYDQQDVLDDEE